MSRTRRRITLQLIPLLDLLLIVLFAQFMQLQDLSTKQAARTEAAEKAVAGSVAEMTAERERLSQLRPELEQERQTIEASLRSAVCDRDQIAGLASEMLKLPDETIRKALAGKSEE